MTIDYDVVIIGGSLAGRYAALAATQLRAKVALVEPKIDYGSLYHHAISEIGNLAQHLRDAVGLSIHQSQVETPEKSPISVVLPEAMLYAQGVVSNVEAQHSAANLAALGVDVIFDSGQFQSSPHLAFAVSNRLLRGRTYLLASGSRPAIPDIDGLSTTGYLTLSNIWQFLYKGDSPGSTLPQNWVILGGVPQSIEVAQTLARLGCRVTLIVKRPQILPNLDPEISQLLQAQLEVDGVRVITQTPVTQVMLIEDKKWIQAGDKAIETDEILVATGQQPNVESLNLAAVDVKWYQRHLVVNEKLQTTNPRIYACGDVIGGYDFANVANYEARIALNNALFFSRSRVNYRCIPLAIFSQPMLAQVGLTEKKAKRQYKHHEILVLRQYFKTVAAAQIRSETTGICKLIVLRNGEILGAEIFGAAAGELINLIALAMSQNLKIQQLENLSPVYPSFSEIVEQCVREWHKQKLNNNIARQDFLESFFQFRRDWNI
ncbi:MAG: dihydrolipoyl dehydrogenase family protein [Aulosira sp. ZfuVER01]|nr:NAD(P)/FAD-dependent oxidoreductase [Aulosira sp. ZfuVER01]MDZ7998592.1 NAD(P)/FAD-dependent oxidoreductase [Aulosira sp. DedVER01a]MDZ8052063.1 NAD(P)/FAD-dependent oxidoreductase [Aulosira sp. ZfuCHP01]